MTIDQAKKLVGNQPEWALRNMIRALSSFSLLNTPEDNERLKAARILLASTKKSRGHAS